MNQEIIESALKNGIILYNKPFLKPYNGVVTLVYLPQHDDFALCYGTCEQDADYVLVKDFKHTWDVRVKTCQEKN